MVIKKTDSRSPISIGVDLGARVTSIGLEFALPAVLGHFLDKWLKTSPWLTVIGAILGMAVGMTHVLRLPAELAEAQKRAATTERSGVGDQTDSLE